MTTKKAMRLVIPKSTLGPSSEDREVIEEGVVGAVLAKVTFLGYKAVDKEPGPNNLSLDGNRVDPFVALTFEVDQRLSKGPNAGKRMLITECFMLSVFEKSNLSKFIKAFTGDVISDDTDYNKYIGAPANLNIMHKRSDDKVYESIGNATPLKKNETPLKLEHTDDSEITLSGLAKWYMKNSIDVNILKRANPDFDFGE